MTALAIAGLGLAAGGAYTSYAAAQDAGDANQSILQQQMEAERLRKQEMEMDARRKSLEIVRQSQVARSMALTNATSQNAQGGSGLQGGYGQIAGQEGFGLMGVSGALEIGRGMFDINQQIAMYKMQLAQAQTQAALGSGLSSLGGSMMGVASTAGKLTAGWGPGSNTPTYQGYGTQMSQPGFNRGFY